MSRIFRYILAQDRGMAPCIDDCLITLATCKPRIRSAAEARDWVIGFRPGRHAHGLVAWAGRVECIYEIGAYEKEFRNRRDAVYRALTTGGFERLRPEYHPDASQFQRDISAPVLVFDRHSSWYFGTNARMLPEQLQHLAASGRGHRVNGSRDGDIEELERWLRDCGQWKCRSESSRPNELSPEHPSETERPPLIKPSRSSC